MTGTVGLVLDGLFALVLLVILYFAEAHELHRTPILGRFRWYAGDQEHQDEP